MEEFLLTSKEGKTYIYSISMLDADWVIYYYGTYPTLVKKFPLKDDALAWFIDNNYIILERNYEV